MKSPAAYYLLLLYCTLMARCAMPVACDALSHLFSEESHIATVHAIYGSHHLQAEVAGAVADTQPCKHTGMQQQDEPTVVHIYTSGYHHTGISPSLLSPQFPIHTYPLHSVSLSCINQPPEHC